MGVENFVPALETLSSLGFEERNPGCPGNFAGMSRTPGGAQKLRAKKLRAHFSFPINDGPIRANRLGDSHESPDSRKSLEGCRTEPLFSLFDLPFHAFAFFLCDFPCFLGVFLLSFPRIWGFPCPKSKENRKRKKARKSKKQGKEIRVCESRLGR